MTAIKTLTRTLFSRVLERFLKLPPAHTRDLVIIKNIGVPMRDGVVLVADHYAPRHTPRSAKGVLPTVLVRSPYGKSGIHTALFGRPFAERGYQVVIQCCRGTEASGGAFDPFRQEAADGLDTTKWIGNQPWFSRDLVTIGPSYMGFVQWALVSAIGSVPEGERATVPQPKAMAVQVASSDFRESVYEGGSFALHTLLRWTRQRWNFRDGRPLSLIAAFGRELFGVENRAVHRAEARLPLRDLDRRVTGGKVEYWQNWLEHDAPDDPWWDSARHRDTVAAVDAPVHLLGGRYDLFLPGLLRDYAALKDAGRQPWLTIGPWTHEDSGWMQIAIPEALAFFDAHVGSATEGVPSKLRNNANKLRECPVRIHVGSADEWRDYADFPPSGAGPERWHLHSGGRLATDRPENSPPDRYRYDPADPTPSVGGSLFGRGAGPADNRALEARPDVLLYTSAPLTSDIEVVGQVEAELHVRSSLQHTDFFVRLCDVEPEGKTINVCDGVLRVIEGRPDPAADGTLHLQIELWPTAYRFKRGHRLRLQVSSGAHPRLARNTGSGEPLGTATKLIVAEQEIFHDPDRPSSLMLNVLD